MTTTVDLSNAHFPYPRLDEQRRQIRLLTLHDTNEAGDLYLTLATISLADEPPYVALSYMWGTDRPTHTITVNGSPYKIRRNLYDFLSTVAAKRLVGKALFVDAIAINQADLAERSSQVRLMRGVYMQATEVIAWLGPWNPSEGSRKSSRGQSFVDRMLDEGIRNETSPRSRRGMDLILEWAKMSISRNDKVSSSLKRKFLARDRQTLVYAYYAAFRPFWTRLWIVQELLLAQRLKLQIGDGSVDPDIVYAWGLVYSLNGESRFASMKAPPPIESGPPIHRSTMILSRRDTMSAQLRYRGPFRPYQVLIPFAFQLCEEPRDNIFGLLGLADSNAVPDYHLSLTQLYLYVWIEGLVDIVQAAKSSKSAQSQRLGNTDDYDELIQSFHVACMGAFRCSGLQTTIQLVTRTTLQHHGLPGARHLVTTMTICGPRERPWFPAMSRIAQVIQSPRLMLLRVLSGRMSPNATLTYHSILDSWSYKLQSLVLALMEMLDCDMVMPDGEVRTYSEWVAEVHRVSSLVKAGVAPVPLEREATSQSSRHRRQRQWCIALKLFLQCNILIFLDYGFTLSVALALAWLGVREGVQLDEDTTSRSWLGLTCIAAMLLRA